MYTCTVLSLFELITTKNILCMNHEGNDDTIEEMVIRIIMFLWTFRRLYITLLFFPYFQHCIAKQLLQITQTNYQLPEGGGVDDHGYIGQWWKGVMVQQNSCKLGLDWGAFDHASHAPQLRSCNCAITIVSCKYAPPSPVHKPPPPALLA